MRHLALDERRARIVAELEYEPEGLDAAELGRRVGLHANSVRWHLGILGDAGIVASHPHRRPTPGRPRILYHLQPGEPSDERDEYRLLATVLADTVSRVDEAPETCEAAGRAWGADLVGGRRANGHEPLAELAAILTEQGFHPEVNERAITMHRCPFQELAEAHPDVVCKVHRGLIAGALTELGSSLEVVGLEIFPRSNVCVARLAPRNAPTANGKRTV